MQAGILFRFLLLALLNCGASQAASAPALKFLTASIQHFPDGAVEWRGAVSCPDPALLSNARLVFFFDFNLDGVADGGKDTTLLSPADCDSGTAERVRTFFPTRAGILTVELRQSAALLDHKSVFAGEMGSLVSLHRFCARPVNGEPEWIEVSNASPANVDLSEVRAEGHLLNGILEPGAKALVGRDSLLLLHWQPESRIITTSSFASLRNTGDTLRVTWNGNVVLDSVIYGSTVDPREGCASALTEENVAAASGYELEISPARWNPQTEFLTLKVKAPGAGTWNLSAYDLDGFEVCAIARKKTGPAEIQLSAPDCPALVNRTGSVLLQLRPSSASTIRKRIRVAR